MTHLPTHLPFEEPLLPYDGAFVVEPAPYGGFFVARMGNPMQVREIIACFSEHEALVEWMRRALQKHALRTMKPPVEGAAA